MPREKVGWCCPFADPNLAVRKLIDIANGIEATFRIVKACWRYPEQRTFAHALTQPLVASRQP
jgi:hypothetical protein